MLINIDHLNFYSFITNSTVIMGTYNSTYPLANGDPGSSTTASGTITLVG
jgi:hypothetical protein